MNTLKELAKKLLSRDQLEKLKDWRSRFNLFGLRLLAGSKMLRRFHFAFFSSAFDREANAVVMGKLLHEQNQAGVETTNFFLRRAIHRLEKGLIMQPRRGVFALDYIEKAVDSYARSLSGCVAPDEMSWAHDVLESFFETTASHPIIDAQRKKFDALEKPASRLESLRRQGVGRVPFTAGTTPSVSVDADAFAGMCRERRSVRWYQNRPVPRDIIDRAVELAVQAPSACNRQPYRFLIFDDPVSVAKVSELPMGVAGFSDNFPAMIAIVGRLRAYPHSRDRHVIYIDGGLAAMSFIFALETLGVSSCSINWPDIPERELAASKLLKLEPDERIVMFISIGYAASEGLVPYSQKLALEDARAYGGAELAG
ncbi:hypothetical protein LCGC14_0362740 [marine sediment metagenome]